MSSQTQLFSAQSHFEAISHQFEARSLNDILLWTLWTFGDKVAQVTSFQPDGMVILDHLAKLAPGIRVITVDTSFLFPETYELWQTVEKRYRIQLDVRQSVLTPLDQARQFGHRLWEKEPDRCCHIRKVEPLDEALQGFDAWISGLRRDQSKTRAATPLLAWDHKHAMVKLNPLAHWTREAVWSYLYQNDIPYNPLHERGYSSIGCVQCTQPATHAGDERSGRWIGQDKVECGIHLGAGI